MSVHEEPPKWVEGQAKCRGDLKFEALRQLIERDVRAFNELPESCRDDDRAFELIENIEGTYPVIHVEQRNAGSGRAVIFKLAVHNQIRIEGSSQHLVQVRWCAKTQKCVLRLTGDPTKRNYEPWEISELALSPLLFGPLT